MPSKTTVNGKEQIFFTTVIVENNQDVVMDVPLTPTRTIGEQTIRVEVVFKLEDGTGSTGQFVATERGVRFTFTNWNSAIGTCTPEPLKFGDFENRKLYITASNHNVGGGNVAQFALLLGAPNE